MSCWKLALLSLVGHFIAHPKLAPLPTHVWMVLRTGVSVRRKAVQDQKQFLWVWVWWWKIMPYRKLALLSLVGQFIAPPKLAPLPTIHIQPDSAYTLITGQDTKILYLLYHLLLPIHFVKMWVPSKKETLFWHFQNVKKKLGFLITLYWCHVFFDVCEAFFCPEKNVFKTSFFLLGTNLLSLTNQNMLNKRYRILVSRPVW